MTLERQPDCVLVVTTINPPTPALAILARDASRLNALLVVVGDEKTPRDFQLAGAEYLDLDAQTRRGFALARQAPTRHYARKNIGYLQAIRNGAEMIVETDDDNMPLDAFWHPRSLAPITPVLRNGGWINVYGYFTSRLIWPRGLPLDEIRKALAPLPAVMEPIICPIQQGLADGDPDVDAIWRLVAAEPVTFAPGPPLALADGSWCPFNSQNTTWWPPAFPLLYLPSFCSFRMTDIWRSFVAQRIVGANGWGVLFTAATVVQERNEHDLMRDFADEVPGYLGNAEICRELAGVDIRSGPDHVASNMIRCYERLVAMGVLPDTELRLLDAWLGDLLI